MHRRTFLLIAVLVVLIGAALVFGFMGGNSGANECHAAPAHTFHITITNGKASTTDIHGRLCDTLTFTNEDAVAREIAFGPHEHHVPYDGVAERVLNRGESFTITFNKTGNYRWHDHLHDEIVGEFTVSQ